MNNKMLDTTGKRIAFLRGKLKYSQVEFGQALNVSQSIISKLENDSSSLTDRMAKDICAKFGVSFEWLWAGEGDIGSIPAGVGGLLRWAKTQNAEVQALVDYLQSSAGVLRELQVRLGADVGLVLSIDPNDRGSLVKFLIDRIEKVKKGWDLRYVLQESPSFVIRDSKPNDTLGGINIENDLKTNILRSLNIVFTWGSESERDELLNYLRILSGDVMDRKLKEQAKAY